MIYNYIDALMTIPLIDSDANCNVKTKTETNTKQIINDDDSDPLFERKIQNATDGLNHDCFNWLYEKVAKFSRENAAVIANYIMSMKTETNLSDNYRRSIIILLSRFSVFFNEQKSFKSMTRGLLVCSHYTCNL